MAAEAEAEADAAAEAEADAAAAAAALVGIGGLVGVRVWVVEVGYASVGQRLSEVAGVTQTRVVGDDEIWVWH